MSYTPETIIYQRSFWRIRISKCSSCSLFSLLRGLSSCIAIDFLLQARLHCCIVDGGGAPFWQVRLFGIDFVGRIGQNLRDPPATRAYFCSPQLTAGLAGCSGEWPVSQGCRIKILPPGGDADVSDRSPVRRHIIYYLRLVHWWLVTPSTTGQRNYSDMIYENVSLFILL